MSQKQNKNGEKADLANSYSVEELARLKEHYDTLNKNLELGEEFYGISERLNKYEPIKAEMQNYEIDFHINEIGVDGKECVFRDSVLNSRVPTGPQQWKQLTNLPVVQKGYLAKNRLQALISALRTFRDLDDSFDIYIDTDMKDARIKELIKELDILRDERADIIAFPMFKDNGKRVVRVKPYDPSTDEQYLDAWGYKKDYLYFVLKKVDIPLRKPIKYLADQLKVSPHEFGIAQMKEAYPTSHQWISIQRPASISKVIDALKPKATNSFKVGNFEYRAEPLKLGDLKGNKYRIALRGLEIESTSTVVECLDHLKDVGFINYFGEKRFMSRKLLATAEIGKLLLTRNWKDAVELVLRPTNEDPTDLKKIKERWFLYDGDIDKACPKGTKCNEFEYKMLMKLKSNPQDYLGALEEIPIGFRMGFVHAYQSYIWNVVVSQRIKRRGLKLEVGDVVWIGKEADLKPEFNEEYALAFESRSVPLKGYKNDPTVKPNYRPNIHFVTKEDIEQNKYTIYDMVLPTPGSEVIFPKNEVGIWITDFLSMDGLTKTRLNDKFCLDNEIIFNSYFLRGTYRKVVVKLNEFKWDFKTYAEVTDPIIFTNPKARQQDKGNEKLALKVEFSLPSDSYVFMALRELVNLETSGFQNMYEMAKRHVPAAIKINKEKIVQEKSIKGRTVTVSRSKSTSKAKDTRPQGKPQKRLINPVKRLDGGLKPVERLDGGIGARKGVGKKSVSQNRNIRQRSPSLVIDLTEDRKFRGNDRNRQSSRDRFLGGGRSISPDFRGGRGRSREVLATDNFIEVRLTNDRRHDDLNRRLNPFSGRDEPVFEPLQRSAGLDSDFIDPFDRGQSNLRMFDGVAVCEFRTEANFAPRDEAEWDREERLERERSQNKRLDRGRRAPSPTVGSFNDARDRRPEPRGRSPSLDSFERNRQRSPFNRNPSFERNQPFEQKRSLDRNQDLHAFPP